MTHVIVHNAQHRAVAFKNHPKATFLSPEHGMDIYGLGYFHALYGACLGDAYIDVQGNPALAQEAFRLGFKHVVCVCDARIFEKLASIAQKWQAQITHTRPEALDLAVKTDIVAQQTESSA